MSFQRAFFTCRRSGSSFYQSLEHSADVSNGQLMLACVVVFAVLLLLLRMLLYVHGHGRR
jgi:hypothetical protein